MAGNISNISVYEPQREVVKCVWEGKHMKTNLRDSGQQTVSGDAE